LFKSTKASDNSEILARFEITIKNVIIML